MSSSNIEESVRAILSDGRQLEVRSDNICKDLLANRFDITALIESLGFALTSTELELRQCSTNLLSIVLTKLPVDTLSAVQLQFIVTFYCDRLKDHHSVAPAVFTGLLAIVQMRQFPGDCSGRLLQQLFAHISVQSQVREDRQKIFTVLKVLCNTQSDHLQIMGTDLVYGCINAIDGERDPRILLYIFEFVPQFLHTYPLGHLAEEMFEVCACYFPVDFHPSPDDATVTRDSLASALAHCLTGHLDFVEHCIPLLLEKLDSQLVVAKLDSLRLLQLAGQRFRSADMETEFPTVWSALHPEIIAAAGQSSKEIAGSALGALQAIVRAASTGTDAGENILVTVFETIMGTLSNVLAAQFDVSMLIAVSCARASKFAAVYVCGKVMPLLLAEVEAFETTNATKTAAIYEHMTHAFGACIEFEAVAQLDADVLAAFHAKLLAGLSGDDTNDVLLPASLQCLSKQVGALSASNRMAIYEHVNRLLVAGGSPAIAGHINQLLVALAERNAAEVKAAIVDRWLSADMLTPSNAANIIDTISGLVRIEAFTESAIAFLLRHVFEQPSQPVCAVALDSLDRLMMDMSESLFDYLYSRCAIADQLVAFVRRETNTDTLGKLSHCIRTLVQRLPVDEQSALMVRHLDGLNFERNADVFMAVGLLSSVSERVDLSAVFERLLNELTTVSMSSDRSPIGQMCMQTICSLVNKVPTTPDSDSTLIRLFGRLDMNGMECNTENTLKIRAWLAKGLLRRGHQQGCMLLDLLMRSLDDKVDCEFALAGFDVLTATRPTLHLPVTRLLHQQKLLEVVLVRIAKSPTDLELCAFAFVLRATPAPALNVNLTKILPLLFQGLALTRPEAVEIYIGVVDTLIGRQSEVMLGHLNRLIPLYVQLCTFKGSLKIRVAALQGLFGITQYPTVALQPYKQDVLHALAAPLDDSKRLVRNAAVIARNKWFLV